VRDVSEADITRRDAVRARVKGMSREGHTAKAAGIAGAQLIANVLALLATIAWARSLGTQEYGQLARMISVFTILMVPASALQAAAARATALGTLGTNGDAALTLRRWLERIVGIAVVAAVVCGLFRDDLAHLMQVDEPWAAAMVVPMGVLWTGVALQRGVLQGIGDYRPVAISLVAEQSFRFLIGLVAVLAGGGVTAIFLAAFPISIVPVMLALAWETRRRLGPVSHDCQRTGLRTMVRRNPIPLLALTLFAVVQNADVVAVAHFFDSDESGAYAQAAVAAKGAIWIAVGLGMYLLPEAAREAAEGKDARHLLGRTAALLSLVAVPMVLVYAVAGDQVLDIVFGDKADLAAAALPWLGAAMALLSFSYLAVQFILALGRRAFVGVIAVAAVAVPVCVAVFDASLKDVAIGLLILNALFAAALLAISMRAKPAPVDRRLTPEDAEALAAAEGAAATEAALG
jgi:O-antigen/teichoic acid export membrane protein